MIGKMDMERMVMEMEKTLMKRTMIGNTRGNLNIFMGIRMF
jgi:hypothetical protein